MPVGTISGTQPYGSVDDRGSTYNVDAQRLMIDMADIAMLEPSKNPLVAILTNDQIKKRQCNATRIEWPENENLPPITVAAGAFTNVATTVNVATGTGAYFRGHDLVRNEATGEIFRVDTTPAADALTVTRGIGAGGTGIASSGSADTLVRLSNASAQGATMPTIKQTRWVFNYNYVQTERDGFGAVDDAMRAKMYGGPVYEYNRDQKQIEHYAAIERALIWGKRDLKTASAGFNDTNRAQLICGGLTYYITSNVFTVGGNFALGGANGIDIALRNVCRYGSNRRIALCSQLVFQGFANLSTAKLGLASFNNASEIFGVPAKQYTSGAGDELYLVLKRDWLDYPTASPGAGGSMVVFDPDNVRLGQFRQTELLENRQAPDADQKTGEWMTKFSLECTLGGGSATGAIGGGSNQLFGAGSGAGVHGIVRGITGITYNTLA